MKRLTSSTRRILLLAATTVAMLSMASVSVAIASNGPATPFKATYSYNNVTWTCSGAHVVNNNTTTGGKDSETCVLSGDEGLYPLGTSSYGAGVWASDYNGALDTTFTVTKVANSDGTFTLSIVATYPAL